MKSLPLGAELFHEDGRTDGPKLIVAFRNFVNALKSTVFKKKTGVLVIFIHLLPSPFKFSLIFFLPFLRLFFSLFRISALSTRAPTPYCLYHGSLANQSYQLSQHNVQRSLH